MYVLIRTFNRLATVVIQCIRYKITQVFDIILETATVVSLSEALASKIGFNGGSSDAVHQNPIVQRA